MTPNLLEGVVVSPYYGLLPEARRVVAQLHELAARFLGRAVVRVLDPEAVVFFVRGPLCARCDVERRGRVLELCVERLLEVLVSEASPRSGIGRP